MKFGMVYIIAGTSLIVSFFANETASNTFNDITILGIYFSLAIILLVGIYQFLIKASCNSIGNDRKKVATYFKPLLYTSQVTAIVVTCFCGYTITMISFFLPVLLTGYYFPKLTLLIAVGAIYASVKILKVIMTAIPKPKVRITAGALVGRSEGASLWQGIDNISKQMNTLPPERVFLSMSDMICVTEAEVESNGQTYSGRSLILSLPVMKLLSKEQSMAVIGHEMAHFSGEDTKITIGFFPIFHDARKSLHEINNVISEFGAAGIVAIPALFILNYFFETFALLEAEISRQCEKEADLKAASIVGHTKTVEALAISHYYLSKWNSFYSSVFQLLHKDGKILNNHSTVFSDFIRGEDAKIVVSELINSNTPHPFNSHPSLKERIEYLGENESVLSQTNTWLCANGNDLINEVKNISEIEQSLTEHENGRIYAISEYLKKSDSNSSLQEKKVAA